MTTDSETLYRQLGRLIEVMPDLTQTPLPADVHLWVSRAYALVKEVNNGIAEIVRADDTAALKIAAYESVWASAQVII